MNGLFFGVNTSDNLQFTLTEGGAETTVSGSTAFQTGTWYHVAVTADRSGNATLFVDGFEDGSGDISANSALNLTTAASAELSIGHQTFDATVSQKPLHGQLDEFRVWNDVRSADEIDVGSLGRINDPESEANLVGYWRLDGVDGTGHAEDLSGNANDASVGHGSPASPFAPVLVFDGSGDGISSGVATANVDNISMEVWVNWNGDLSQEMNIFYNGAVASNGYGFVTGLANSDTEMHVDFNIGGGLLETDYSLVADEWTHLAAVRDGGTWTLYVNGQAETITAGTATATPTAPGTSTEVGSAIDATYLSWGGELAEARMWTAARSQTDIQDNKDTTLHGDEGNLAGYWPMNEGGGTTAYDHTGNNDGTITDATYEAVSPMPMPSIAQAMEFDGTGDYVVTGLATVASDFTVETWFKTGSNPADGNFKSILSKRTATTDATAEFNLQVTNTGNLNFFMGNGSAQGVTLATAGALAADTWYHVAVTHDSSDGLTEMFLNGAWTAEGTFTGTRQSGGNTIEIGRYNNGADQFMDGVIYDTRVWNTIREDTQIQSGMTGLIAADTAGLVANWRLDDASSGTATTALDHAGLANGTISGDPQYVLVGPHLFTDVVTTDEDIAIRGTIDADDGNTGDTLVFSLSGAATNGTVSVDADGTYAYTPNTDFIGVDRFTVQVSDGTTAVTKTITVLVTRAGNDEDYHVLSGTDSATLEAGLNDFVAGSTGDDTVTLIGAAEAGDFVDLAEGTDSLALADGGNTLTAANAETVTGGSGNDDITIAGSLGATVDGGAGSDTLKGGAGNDTFIASLGADTIDTASGGIDKLEIESNLHIESAVFNSGTGNLDFTLEDDSQNLHTTTVLDHDINPLDELSFDLDEDGALETFLIGTNLDSSGNALDTVVAGTTGADTILGGTGDDLLLGNDGIDTLSGNAGDDYLIGGADDDIIDGGTHGPKGDTVSFDFATTAVTVDLSGGAIGAGSATGGGGSDTLTGIENIEGSDHDDTLTGDDADNTIVGGEGNDTILGLGGTDFLLGGAGIDRFEFDLASDSGVGAGNRDIIDDFDAGTAGTSTDIIDLNGIVTGTFSYLGDETNAFTGGSTGNTEARFNKNTKILEIDADGDAAVDMEIELTNTNVANLDNDDFESGLG